MAISEKVESPPMVVDGEELLLEATRPVHDPATGEVPAHVPEATALKGSVEAFRYGDHASTNPKPSELTPLTALMPAREALAAGLPPGILNVVTGPGPEAGGVKGSGFGKDMSMYALEEDTAIKHVVFELSGAPRKAWYDAVSKPL